LASSVGKNGWGLFGAALAVCNALALAVCDALALAVWDALALAVLSNTLA
jgi:hypothetical protein